jgi:hypothetical protein
VKICAPDVNNIISRYVAVADPAYLKLLPKAEIYYYW